MTPLCGEAWRASGSADVTASGGATLFRYHRAAALAHRIVNIFINENLLTSFRGEEDTVYAPVRSQANRIRKMLDELNVSQDEIWLAVSSL
jgi:hypothetical protein